MTGRGRISGLWWALGFLVSAWLVSGCAIHNPGGDQTLQSRPNESALIQYETRENLQVRRINVGINRGVMKEFQVGKMPDGYLVTVAWTDNIQLVKLLCAHHGAGGCQRSERVLPDNNHPGYHRQFLVLYVREGISDLTLKILAHEICHAVASSQALQPDPCHNENGGRIGRSDQ